MKNYPLKQCRDCPDCEIDKEYKNGDFIRYVMNCYNDDLPKVMEIPKPVGQSRHEDRPIPEFCTLEDM